MKHFSLYLTLLLFAACSGGTDNNNSSAMPYDQNTTENSINGNTPSADPNSTAALIEELSKVPPLKDYKVEGDVHIETMTFSSFGMGDMAHNIFIDSKNEERDFAGNLTNTELFLESQEASDENGGYESNPTYVGKKFTVGWRRVKSTKKPTDFIEELYQEFDEIIYLKQLN